MQLSIFDVADPVELDIYEVLHKHDIPYEIEKYRLYRQYGESLKYYYVKTKCGKLIDLCLSPFQVSVIFMVYDKVNQKLIDKRVIP